MGHDVGDLEGLDGAEAAVMGVVGVLNRGPRRDPVGGRRGAGLRGELHDRQSGCQLPHRCQQAGRRPSRSATRGGEGIDGGESGEPSNAGKEGAQELKGLCLAPSYPQRQEKSWVEGAV